MGIYEICRTVYPRHREKRL